MVKSVDGGGLMSRGGDFKLYQGVWRMQPLPGCRPNGGDASRLSYAVELKPSLPVPVALLEGRIAADLVANMKAIRIRAEADNTQTTAGAGALAAAE